MAEEAMNVPFGSILVWSLVMKMASMFCGMDLNASLCQMMEGFIRFFFLVFFFFFWGGHCCLSRWESFGIDVLPRFFELSDCSGGFQRIHETVPGNPKCQAWCICAHTSCPAFSHRNGLMKISGWIAWVLLLHTGSGGTAFLWKPWETSKGFPLSCPKMSKNAVSPTSLNRLKPSTKHKQTLHIFSIREDVSKKEHGIPLVFSEKMIPLMTTFLPRSG